MTCTVVHALGSCSLLGKATTGSVVVLLCIVDVDGLLVTEEKGLLLRL